MVCIVAKFTLCNINCKLFLQDLSLSSHVHCSFCLGSCRQRSSIDLQSEVKNLRLELSDLHLKHKSLARKLQSRQDIDAKNKAELKRLRGNFLCVFHLVGHQHMNLDPMLLHMEIQHSRLCMLLLIKYT